jgi:hypothetical protein
MVLLGAVSFQQPNVGDIAIPLAENDDRPAIARKVRVRGGEPLSSVSYRKETLLTNSLRPQVTTNLLKIALAGHYALVLESLLILIQGTCQRRFKISRTIA